MSNSFSPTEAQTRERLIDPALRKAGWDVNNPDQVRIEIPVDDFDPAAWQALDAKLKRLQDAGVPYNVKLPSGICDYALYRPDGDIIAVVEGQAHQRGSPPGPGPDRVLRPRDRQAAGLCPLCPHDQRPPHRLLGRGPRQPPPGVAGFFSPADLRNLLYLRDNRKPLTAVPINQAITDRPYQLEAIKRLCGAFEEGKKRRALLVMATGTGKTRVASLADLFMRANQAQDPVRRRLRRPGSPGADRGL